MNLIIFTEWFQIRKESFPIITKQIPSKVLFYGKKTQWPFGRLLTKILIVGSSK